MRTRLLSTLLLILAAAAPATAELRFVTRMDVTRSASGASPMAAALGNTLAQLAPDGPVEITILVGANGLRAEAGKAAMGMPAGAITIITPGGELIVMNAAAKTYWKMPTPDIAAAMAIAGVHMRSTVAPAVAAEAILGVPTERTTFEVKMELAMLAQMPPEARQQMAAMEKDMVMHGEVWTAVGRFDQYAPILKKSSLDALAAFGLADVIRNFTMKSVMRVGGVEMRSEVVKIAEEAVPASMFTVPAGYTEVPAPGGR
ncbi:MAG: DUF4412 domain-containing protein [Acidobacteriota bacterium]|nr:DUF4412 domain-containing protein [Acidobacteriota bacterium]